MNFKLPKYIFSQISPVIARTHEELSYSIFYKDKAKTISNTNNAIDNNLQIKENIDDDFILKVNKICISKEVLHSIGKFIYSFTEVISNKDKEIYYYRNSSNISKKPFITKHNPIFILISLIENKIDFIFNKDFIEWRDNNDNKINKGLFIYGEVENNDINNNQYNDELVKREVLLELDFKTKEIEVLVDERILLNDNKKNIGDLDNIDSKKYDDIENLNQIIDCNVSIGKTKKTNLLYFNEYGNSDSDSDSFEEELSSNNKVNMDNKENNDNINSHSLNNRISFNSNVKDSNERESYSNVSLDEEISDENNNNEEYNDIITEEDIALFCSLCRDFILEKMLSKTDRNALSKLIINNIPTFSEFTNYIINNKSKENDILTKIHNTETKNNLFQKELKQVIDTYIINNNIDNGKNSNSKIDFTNSISPRLIKSNNIKDNESNIESNKHSPSKINQKVCDSLTNLILKEEEDNLLKEQIDIQNIKDKQALIDYRNLLMELTTKGIIKLSTSFTEFFEQHYLNNHSLFDSIKDKTKIIIFNDIKLVIKTLIDENYDNKRMEFEKYLINNKTPNILNKISMIVNNKEYKELIYYDNNRKRVNFINHLMIKYFYKHSNPDLYSSVLNKDIRMNVIMQFVENMNVVILFRRFCYNSNINSNITVKGLSKSGDDALKELVSGVNLNDDDAADKIDKGFDIDDIKFISKKAEFDRFLKEIENSSIYIKSNIIDNDNNGASSNNFNIMNQNEKEDDEGKISNINFINQLELEQQNQSTSKESISIKICKILNRIKKLTSENKSTYTSKKEASLLLINQLNRYLKTTYLFGDSASTKFLNQLTTYNKIAPSQISILNTLTFPEEVFLLKLKQEIEREISYEESLKKFNSYKSFPYANYINNNRKKELFTIVISDLRKHNKLKFKEMLVEKIGMNNEINWYEAQSLLQEDLRYQSILESDREIMFKNYNEKLFEKIEKDFMKLVDDSSFISKDIDIDDFITIEEVLKKLCMDIRGKRMMKYPERRDKWIKMRVRKLKSEYIESKRRNRRNEESNSERNNADRNHEKSRYKYERKN